MVRTSVGAADFQFDRDTPAFANQTVFEYHEGHPSLRRPSTVRRDTYKRHCFVLCRSGRQFKKFARFDSNMAPLEDTVLCARTQAVTTRLPWPDRRPDVRSLDFHGYI